MQWWRSSSDATEPGVSSIPIHPLQRVFYPQNLACTPQNDKASCMLLYIEGTKIRNKTRCTPNWKMQWEPLSGLLTGFLGIWKRTSSYVCTVTTEISLGLPSDWSDCFLLNYSWTNCLAIEKHKIDFSLMNSSSKLPDFVWLLICLRMFYYRFNQRSNTLNGFYLLDFSVRCLQIIQ